MARKRVPLALGKGPPPNFRYTNLLVFLCVQRSNLFKRLKCMICGLAATLWSATMNTMMSTRVCVKYATAPGQRLIKLNQLVTAHIFWFRSCHLCMDDGSEVCGELNLVKSDLHCGFALNVSYATICKCVPLDL